MIRFAVIADPHVHDCTWKPAGTDLPEAIRSFASTADSTRIYNESVPAFRRALEMAVEAGVKLVLLPGDLTDDGQLPHLRRALALLEEFRAAHGLRVLAAPGNHDFFALAGRRMAKPLIIPSGEVRVLDSDHFPEAACLGTLPALRMMAHLGYQPEPTDLHWESPFGTDPAWEARNYRIFSADGSASAEIIDASYLVEPIPGLWVLSLDSNVPVPKDGAVDLEDAGNWHDPTSNGWPVVLRHRAHLLPWITDVAARAKAQGKRLISFSHYPVLDALGISAGEVALLNNATGLARRAPSAEVAQALAASGVGLHLSGHLHVNTVARYAGPERAVVNIAVPSTVGFGPAIKLFEMEPAEAGHEPVTRVKTLPLIEVPGHDLAYPAYRREAEAAGAEPPAAAYSRSHGEFLDRHLEILVPGRYIAREWPKEMADYAAKGSVADLLADLGYVGDEAGASSERPGPLIDMALWAEARAVALPDLVLDWYRLRKAGELSRDYILPQRLEFYRRLLPFLPAPPAGEAPPQKLAGLLALFAQLFTRLPDRDFTITGEDLRVTSG